MRVLMLGDIVGRPGRVALKNSLPYLKDKFELDMVIVNGENAAGGSGITVKVMNEIFGFGVDVITTGNHIWKNKEIYAALNAEPRLLRPDNYPAGAPGTGLGLYFVNGKQVAVLNLLGRNNLEDVDCPFQRAEKLLVDLPAEVKLIFLDFHAETSSEKKAMGWFLDGKVSVVAGTHTHVQTNDAQTLPQGTGYMTDLGMCGVEASVLGLAPEVIVKRFVTKMPARFTLAEGDTLLCGAVFTVDDQSGRCIDFEIVRMPA